MSKLPVDQPNFWIQRIKSAQARGDINLAIWDASNEDWENAKRIHRDILKEEIQETDCSILDVGCGLGTLLEILPSGCEARYTGIDISPELIDLAYQKYPNRSFYCRDVRDLELDNVSFDYVITRSFGGMIRENLGNSEWLKILGILSRIARKAIIVMDYTDPYEYQRLCSNDVMCNRKLPKVKVEIGPGSRLDKDWITVGREYNKDTDKICVWGEERLPFDDNSVDLLYASHVLEHIPWFATMNALNEAYRVLSSKGKIEVWVPNFEYLIKCYQENKCGDDWRKFNQNNDPMVWLNGRLFTYGGPKGLADPNWHRTVFDERYLVQCLTEAGFFGIERLVKPRGHDHGPINLGMCGYKL